MAIDSRFTERDLHRLTGYNAILTACIKDAHNLTELNEMLPHLSTITIRNYCTVLMGEGYLTMQKQRIGVFKRIANFYTTVIPHYSIDNLVPISIKIKNTMKVNGSKTTSKDLDDEEDAPINAHITKVLFNSSSARSAELRSAYRQQCKLDRLAMKSPKTFVSGSSLSGF